MDITTFFGRAPQDVCYG